MKARIFRSGVESRPHAKAIGPFVAVMIKRLSTVDFAALKLTVPESPLLLSFWSRYSSRRR